jgi:hypothetical protein
VIFACTHRESNSLSHIVEKNHRVSLLLPKTADRKTHTTRNSYTSCSRTYTVCRAAGGRSNDFPLPPEIIPSEWNTSLTKGNSSSESFVEEGGGNQGIISREGRESTPAECDLYDDEVSDWLFDEGHEAGEYGQRSGEDSDLSDQGEDASRQILQDLQGNSRDIIGVKKLVRDTDCASNNDDDSDVAVARTEATACHGSRGHVMPRNTDGDGGHVLCSVLDQEDEWDAEFLAAADQVVRVCMYVCVLEYMRTIDACVCECV